MGDHHLVAFGPGAISFAPDRMFDPGSFPSAGAGMSGTAPDFMRFLEAMRTGGAPVLKPSTVELMATNAIGDIPIMLPGRGFGLGWAVLKDPANAATPQNAGQLDLGRGLRKRLVRRPGGRAVGGDHHQHRHRRHDRDLSRRHS